MRASLGTPVPVPEVPPDVPSLTATWAVVNDTLVLKWKGNDFPVRLFSPALEQLQEELVKEARRAQATGPQGIHVTPSSSTLYDEVAPPGPEEVQKSLVTDC